MIRGRPFEDLEPRLFYRRFSHYGNSMGYVEALWSPYLGMFPEFSERVADPLYFHLKFCKRDRFSNLSADRRELEEQNSTKGEPLASRPAAPSRRTRALRCMDQEVQSGRIIGGRRWITAEVTVLIPSYNYARYLRQAVESAVHQEGVDHDVVIVDNASTDDSLQVARDLAATLRTSARRLAPRQPGDRLVVQPMSGRASGRVHGAALRRRLPHPGLLAAGRRVHGRPSSGGPGVRPGRALPIRRRRGRHRRGARSSDVERPIVYPGATWIDKRCESGKNPIRAPEALMRTEVQLAAGPYDPRCPYTFDLNMWLRMAARSDVAVSARTPASLLSTARGQLLQRVVSAIPSRTWNSIGPRSSTSSNRSTPRRRPTDGRERPAGRWPGRRRWSASRAFARASSPAEVEESEDLLALARSISGEDLSRLETWNWAVQRKIGPRRMRVVSAVRAPVRRSRVQAVRRRPAPAAHGRLIRTSPLNSFWAIESPVPPVNREAR